RSQGRPHVGGGPHPRGDLLPRRRRALRRGATQAAHRRRILREHWGVAEHPGPHRRIRPVRTDRAAARARSTRRTAIGGTHHTHRRLSTAPVAASFQGVPNTCRSVPVVTHGFVSV